MKYICPITAVALRAKVERFSRFLEAVSDWVYLPMCEILFSGEIILSMN